MGRTPDPPGLQAAKGNPGRRSAKPPAPPRQVKFGSVEPPAWLTGRAYLGALKIWSRLAPTLVRLNVLTPTDVDAFARYCTHLADWIRLTDDIRKNGETQSVKTVSGDEMIRFRPEYKAREVAEKRVIEAEDRFGLTPAHRLSLYRDMNALNVPVGDLFSRKPAEDRAPEPADGHDDIVGFARRPDPAADRRPN